MTQLNILKGILQTIIQIFEEEDVELSSTATSAQSKERREEVDTAVRAFPI
jgi:hypothetical protein